MKVTAVFPTYNAQDTIGPTIEEAKRAKLVDEILVVDGYSADGTVQEAKNAGAAVVFQYEQKYPGKGNAMKTAVDKATGDVIVFYDADTTNFEGWMLDKLVKPILDGRCDHTIANFIERRGRVTELVVKPLLRIFFPEVKFHNPLAGEFAIRREVMKNLEYPDDWGIETAIAIDVVMKGYKSLEIDFAGSKQHDSKPVEHLVIMSEQILHTFFAKVIEYDRMVQGVEGTEHLPADWIMRLRNQVAEKGAIELQKEDIDTFFGDMDDTVHRRSELEDTW